jgi:hypothetical protein
METTEEAMLVVCLFVSSRRVGASRADVYISMEGGMTMHRCCIIVLYHMYVCFISYIVYILRATSNSTCPYAVLSFSDYLQKSIIDGHDSIISDYGYDVLPHCDCGNISMVFIHIVIV